MPSGRRPTTRIRFQLAGAGRRPRSFQTGLQPLHDRTDLVAVGACPSVSQRLASGRAPPLFPKSTSPSWGRDLIILAEVEGAPQVDRGLLQIALPIEHPCPHAVEYRRTVRTASAHGRPGKTPIQALVANRASVWPSAFNASVWSGSSSSRRRRSAPYPQNPRSSTAIYRARLWRRS